MTKIQQDLESLLKNIIDITLRPDTSIKISVPRAVLDAIYKDFGHPQEPGMISVKLHLSHGTVELVEGVS